MASGVAQDLDVKKKPFEEFQQAFRPDAADRVKSQAHEIWLAGLGAFAKAQEEGAKAFERLVKDGTEMQRRTQALAEEKLSEMSERMQSMAGDLSERAGGQFGRLEGLFEERVAKAMARLKVPTADEVASLQARIDELQATLAAAGFKPRPSARAARAGSPARKAKTAPPKN